MIDLHAHVVLEGVLGRAGDLGPELIDDPACPTFRVGDYVLEGVRYRGSAFMDLGVRLERMDSLGITHEVLSPNPLTYFEHADAGIAADFARWHNDEMARLVSRSPGRVSGFAQLPVQDPALASAELRRSVVDLGLVGGYIGTDYGVALDDPALDELYTTCVDLDVPLFIHPGVAGVDGPLRDARLRRFDLDLYAGFAHEEIMALVTLIFGGVLHRHPAVRICVSHGGGALVSLIGKLRTVARSRSSAPDWLAGPGELDRQVRRLWFDGHVTAPETLDALRRIVGDDRLVAGMNLAGWDQPAADPFGELGDRLDANARQLLGTRFARAQRSTGSPSS